MTEMKFEGQQINIPVKGIMRAGTDNLCADGAMNEVVGLEYKDGSWLPYKLAEKGLRVITGSIPFITALDLSKVWVHKTSDNTSHFIFQSGTDIYYEDSHGPGSIPTYHATLLIGNVKDIEFVGNMLCVATTTGMRYFRWNNGRYNDVNKYFPRIALRANAGFLNDEEKIEGVQYCVKNLNGKIADNESSYNYWKVARASLIAALGGLSQKGGMSGYAFACYAYRLTSGELIQASAPFLVGKPLAKFGSYTDGVEQSTINGEISFDGAGLFPVTLHASDANGGEPSGPDYAFSTFEIYNNNGTVVNRIPYEMIEGITEVKKRTIQESLFCSPMENYGVRSIVNTTGDGEKATEIGTNPYIPDVMFTSMECETSSAVKESFGFGYAAGVGLQYSVKANESVSENIVDSICICLTQEVSPYVITEDEDEAKDMFYGIKFAELSMTGEKPSGSSSHSTVNRTCVFGAMLPLRKSEDKIIEELQKLNSFYVVKEINLSELPNDTDWHDIELEGKLGDSLVVQEQLPLTAIDCSYDIANHIDSYNFRLHQFDYTKTLFEGHSYDDMTYFGGEGQYTDIVTQNSGRTFTSEIVVEISDDEGKRSVERSLRTGVGDIYLTIGPFLSYPDKNARKLTVRIFDDNYVYYRTFDLKQLRGLGMAGYIDPSLKPIYVDIFDTWDKESYTGDRPYYTPSNITKSYSNGIKVSDVAYPMYFPSNFTYRVGNGKIIGLACLTVPLSQDNFGPYSLIVFCSDGIYSMEVDKTGDGVYTNVPPPMSPEVCVNPRTICEIGGAVIFASDKGLMVLTSDGVDEFAPHLNGEIRFAPDAASLYPKDGRYIYNKIVTESTMTPIKDVLSTNDFIDYLHGVDTVVSYVSKKNKLVVYNSGYDYIYLIDIPTRNTTKLYTSFAFDDDNSPVETYWKYEGNKYVLKTFEYRSQTGTVDCLIQSRPIKIQQDDKCSFRLVLTGYFEGADLSDKWATLLVLGSLDGDHWHAIGLKQRKLDKPFHNFGCVTDRESWKYLMFVFSGDLSKDSHIDSIDLTAIGKYNNKKR